MMTRRIAFFDSGIGGIPYLVHLRELAPEFSYIYLADTKNFPYGLKNGEQLRVAVLGAVEKLIKKGEPDAIVIACNTATVATLPYLREMFRVPFVGVVPAVKPAAIYSENKRIGLFATNKTVSDSYVDSLISQFANRCEVFRYADYRIVDFIERKFIDSSEPEILEMLKPAAAFFSEKKVDHVVLGCTHFLFVDKYMEKLLPENIKTIDSREGVSRQALRIVSDSDMMQGKDWKGKETDKQKTTSGFFTTSETPGNSYYRKIAGMFSLEYKGVI